MDEGAACRSVRGWSSHAERNVTADPRRIQLAARVTWCRGHVAAAVADVKCTSRSSRSRERTLFFVIRGMSDLSEAVRVYHLAPRFLRDPKSPQDSQYFQYFPSEKCFRDLQVPLPLDPLTNLWKISIRSNYRASFYFIAFLRKLLAHVSYTNVDQHFWITIESTFQNVDLTLRRHCRNV